jgi:hypothetical protein
MNHHAQNVPTLYAARARLGKVTVPICLTSTRSQLTALNSIGLNENLNPGRKHPYPDEQNIDPALIQMVEQIPSNQSTKGDKAQYQIYSDTPDEPSTNSNKRHLSSSRILENVATNSQVPRWCDPNDHSSKQTYTGSLFDNSVVTNSEIEDEQFITVRTDSSSQNPNCDSAYNSNTNNDNSLHPFMDHCIYDSNPICHQPMYQTQGHNCYADFGSSIGGQSKIANKTGGGFHPTWEDSFPAPHTWGSQGASDNLSSLEYMFLKRPENTPSFQTSRGSKASDGAEASNINQSSKPVQPEDILINASAASFHQTTTPLGRETGSNCSTLLGRARIQYAAYPDLSDAATASTFLRDILQNEDLAENNLPPCMSLLYAPCPLPDYKWLEKDGQKVESEWYTRAEKDERQRKNETLNQFTERLRNNREKGRFLERPVLRDIPGLPDVIPYLTPNWKLATYLTIATPNDLAHRVPRNSPGIPKGIKSHNNLRNYFAKYTNSWRGNYGGINNLTREEHGDKMTGLIHNVFTTVHNRSAKTRQGKKDTDWSHKPLTPLNILFNTRWSINTQTGQMWDPNGKKDVDGNHIMHPLYEPCRPPQIVINIIDGLSPKIILKDDLNDLDDYPSLPKPENGHTSQLRPQQKKRKATQDPLESKTKKAKTVTGGKLKKAGSTENVAEAASSSKVFDPSASSMPSSEQLGSFHVKNGVLPHGCSSQFTGPPSSTGFPGITSPSHFAGPSSSSYRSPLAHSPFLNDHFVDTQPVLATPSYLNPYHHTVPAINPVHGYTRDAGLDYPGEFEAGLTEYTITPEISGDTTTDLDLAVFDLNNVYNVYNLSPMPSGPGDWGASVLEATGWGGHFDEAQHTSNNHPKLYQQASPQNFDDQSAIIQFPTSASGAIDGVAAPSSRYTTTSDFGGLVDGVQGQFSENEGFIQQGGLNVQAP